ncbi:uncharacterized protein K444DRAFT_517021, partial [Hyaloscypha bicolor E]
YINYILVGLIDIIYIVYLDNILIYLENPEYNLIYIRLFINLVKYEFNIKKIEFLGFIISPDNIEIKANRVIAIRK